MAYPRIIVNPAAGRGRAAAARGAIDAAFAALNEPIDLLVTAQPGDATRWAYEAATQGVPYVAGAGGDGTANEIINGLAHWVRDGGDARRLPKFGMIPVGTGNDFAYNFSLSHDVAAACETLARQQTRLLDVGLVESDAEKPLYFVNGVGMGFDAIVNIESRKVRFGRGGMVFLPAVLKTILFYFRAPRVVARLNGAVYEDNLMMISVMNGVRFGAMFHMTPGSKIDDRLLNLCFARRMNRPQMLAMVPRFIRGTHPGHPKIKLAATDRVTIDSSEPLPAHVEGEIYTVRAQHFEYSIQPWQLQMIC
jgi:diacylglycerol kinase (ATP)